MQNKFLTAMGLYSSKYFHVGDEIPTSIKTKALEAFCIPKSETVLGVFHAGERSSSTNGLAIGVYGIYWKNSFFAFSKKTALSWDEIHLLKDNIKNKSGFLKFNSDIMFDTSVILKPKSKEVLHLLNNLASFYIADKKTESVPNDVELRIKKTYENKWYKSPVKLMFAIFVGFILLTPLISRVGGGGSSSSQSSSYSSSSNSNSEMKKLASQMILLNGHLCAKAKTVSPLTIKDKYEVVCQLYRGGTTEKAYIIDANSGTAWPQ